jgi:hypothetical protein
MVSRATEDGSAPAFPPGVRVIATQRSQRITEHLRQSKIEHYVVVRPRAADEHASVDGSFDGVRVVVHVAGDECRLAVVADASAARRADGYVAGFGELEEVRVVVAPGIARSLRANSIVGPLPGWPEGG